MHHRSLVYMHAGYISAVTIPAGAHSMVIREIPFSADNYFGRYIHSSVSESTPHHTPPPSVALWWVDWECRPYLHLIIVIVSPQFTWEQVCEVQYSKVLVLILVEDSWPYSTYLHMYIQYLSQETLRNPRIFRVGNPQVFHGIAKDIRGIVYGCPQNRARVSAESCKGVRGIVNNI